MPKRPTLRDRVDAAQATPPPQAWESAYARTSAPAHPATDHLHEAVAPARVPEGERLEGAGEDGLMDGPLHLLAERTRDLARAQADLLSEWLLSPLWGAGVGSPTALTDHYTRVAGAYRALAEAYLAAATSWPGNSSASSSSAGPRR